MEGRECAGNEVYIGLTGRSIRERFSEQETTVGLGQTEKNR